MKALRLALVSDFPQGAIRSFEAGGKRVAVSRVGDEWFAFEDRCSHDDGELASGFIVGNNEVECPRHGARFDMKNGSATRMPAVAPIETYKVEIRGQDVWVMMNEEVEAQ